LNWRTLLPFQATPFVGLRLALDKVVLGRSDSKLEGFFIH
jgi:hypothetical protein